MKTIHQNLPACFDTSGLFYFVILDSNGFIQYANPLFQKKILPFAAANYALSFFMRESSPNASFVQKKFKEFLSGKQGSHLSDQHLLNAEGVDMYIRWEMNRVDHEEYGVGTIQCIGIDITEQKNDHSKLFKKEEQAYVLENVSDIIMTIDGNEVVKTWNKVAESFYGISSGAAIGKPITDLITLEYENTTREVVIHEMKTKGIWKGEVAYTNKTGEKKYLHNSIVLLKNNGKDEPGVLVVGRDITERKSAERNLAASELFYRNLISNSLDGMLILNEKGIIQFVSPSVENILGYTKEDIIEQNAFGYIHPDDYYFSLDGFEQELNSQSVLKSIVIRLLHKNGHWVWCLLRGHNLVSNPYVNGMVIYFYDDTLRKNAREVLKESESRFRQLITDLQSGVMLMNAQMEITLCNKAGLEILGYQDEEKIIGRTTSDMDWDFMDENNLPLEFTHRPTYLAYHHKKAVKNVVMGVKRPSMKSRIWLLVNAVPILNQTGELLHIITSFSDITDRIKLEQKFREEEINKQKQLTQATIDGQEKERKEIGKELHDNVGQQLTTTKLFLDMAKSNAEDNVLEMINMAIKGVSDAINEVRSISRSLVPPTLGDLGLIDSVKELCHSLKRSQAFQIRFYHNEFDESSLPANQALMLYRIIQEQVNNIIKHAEARAVILKLGSLNDMTVLEIVDNGKGFDPANYKKGLGLINMTNRAELFNGKLEIISGIDKGCRIRVSIPVNHI